MIVPAILEPQARHKEQAMAAAQHKYPVTILSGFLGSGKTTLLNRLLRADHGLRIVVMVNDFGDVNVDKDLVTGQTGNLMELSGGCMCCTIRDDLFGATRELLDSGREFDCILVETSGLAEPSAVARTFQVPELEQKLRLDALITVVDAVNIGDWLTRNPVAEQQVRYADLLVVNKLDLLDAAEAHQVKSRLAQLNDQARIYGAVYGDVPHALLLDVDARKGRQDAKLPGLFTGLSDDGGDTAAEEGAPLRGKARPAASHAAVVSCAAEHAMEVDYDAFDRFLAALPDGVYRAKGTLAIRGIRRRVIFHRVGLRNVLDQGAPWADGEARVCRVMFLGEDYAKQQVLEAFAACDAEAVADADTGTAAPVTRALSAAAAN